jgi:cytoskeleton protein RodZ
MNSDDDKKSGDDSRSRDLSPGKLLVWGRERSNLTQEQVATELYMTVTKVRALESDDYRHMGTSTFIRGYLRAYANLVHLDVAQVLAAYDRHLQKSGVVETQVPRRAESTNKPIWQFVLFILIALGVLWLISIWFFDNRQQTLIDRPTHVTPQLDISHPLIASSSSAMSESNALSEENAADKQDAMNKESTASEQTAPLIAGEVTAVPSTAAASSVQVANESLANATMVNAITANGQENTSSSVASESASSAAVVNASLAVNESGLAVLALRFSAECWLEVSDAGGDVLAADLQAAGSHLELKGKAPFDVKLGNARAATLELNGTPVAITPLSTTNVLSLKVGQ